MASIYPRGEVLWMKFKNVAGKQECRSTGFRRGQEAQARELAAEVDRQATIERGGMLADVVKQRSLVSRPRRREAIPSVVLPPPTAAYREAVATSPVTIGASTRIVPIGPPAAPGSLPVRVYGEEWWSRRAGLSSAESEDGHLRLHIYPYIGHMAIADVRPRHVRDLVNALKQKITAGPKREKLAPRTVRHIFATLRLLFKSAVIDEHVTASPVVVEKGVLPKNVDKDPTWRSTALYEREELLALIQDERVAAYRRVAYALEGIAGVRHGEMAGVRWCDFHDEYKPLAKLIFARSGERERTKTQVTRDLPVHPTLSTILVEWRRSGWTAKYGRPPTPDDLILPTETGGVRKASNTLKHLKTDLKRLGMRRRRGHDLRRTFITLALTDGVRRDVLKTLTHPGEKDVIGLYTTFPWSLLCSEIMKLSLPLASDQSTSVAVASPEVRPAALLDHAARPANDLDADAVAHHVPEAAQIDALNAQIIPFPVAAVAGYTTSYDPDCSSRIKNDSSELPVSCSVGRQVTKPLLYH